jgi:hypothetical protein
MGMSKNIRISQALYELIEENRGNKPQGQYIEEMIRHALSRSEEPTSPAKDARIDEILELVRGLPETIKEVFEDLTPSGPAPGLASIPGVQQGAATLPKNAYCKHCGSCFAGSKYAQVCVECEDAGHKRVPPAECPECQAGAAL